MTRPHMPASAPAVPAPDSHSDAIAAHIARITHEFIEGFDLLKKYPKSVTIFGSSMAHPDSLHYKKAEELAGRIATDLKYAVITGGGPGIMEAANKGAREAGGNSIGLNISLPREHMVNDYSSDHMKFTYFFSRKAILAFGAEAYIFFPGGYGTFDELFSVLTLIQTGKIPRVPVILFDSKFWNELKTYLHKIMVTEYHTLNTSDLGLIHITDSMDNAIEIIRTAPVSEWWRNLN